MPDTRALEAALDEWLVAAGDASRAASLEAAQAIQDRTQEKLTMQWHGAGTRTPSVRGLSPAAISGNLAASIQVSPTNEGAMVGPTDSAHSRNGPYGRSQEMGTFFMPHDASGVMSWEEEGVRHFSKGHELPERPYLKPAFEEVRDSGEINDIYYEHWHDAQRIATGE